MLFESFSSPLGDIILCAHQAKLSGLWFVGQKYERRGADESLAETAGDREVLNECRHWLDGYFSGSAEKAMFPLAPKGTAFQHMVWQELCRIPYGETVSYAELARRLNCKSARAVGSAVGRNPVSIVIPCHRVVGSDGSITGYAGGIERKEYLLALEKGNIFQNTQS